MESITFVRKLSARKNTGYARLKFLFHIVFSFINEDTIICDLKISCFSADDRIINVHLCTTVLINYQMDMILVIVWNEHFESACATNQIYKKEKEEIVENRE